MPGIAPATTVGAVHLTVADLSRSLDYYERAIGLQVHARENGTARLGAGGDDLLVLYEEAGAQPAPQNTGLFHFALLVPTRVDLARWLTHAAQAQIELTGASDHLVSEALYLRDPDWHGIEIYRDRPRDEWEVGEDGQVALATLPLDLEGLVGVLDGGEPPFEHIASGTRMGHVHLQVADVHATDDFYADVVGFDITAHYADQATFLSAGGYHHHLGANVWNSRGAGPPRPGSAALRHAEIVLPDRAAIDEVAGRVADAGQDPVAADNGSVLVRDPSGNALSLRARP
jgi:catechol 2,3-dioxygenase